MTVNYLKMEILSFQSCTNPLRLSSLKGWVRGLTFSTDGFLILTPQIRYRAKGHKPIFFLDIFSDNISGTIIISAV